MLYCYHALATVNTVNIVTGMLSAPVGGSQTGPRRSPGAPKREAPVVPRVSPNPHGPWVMGPDRGGAGDRPWRPPDRRLATTPALLAVWPRGGAEGMWLYCCWCAPSVVNVNIHWLNVKQVLLKTLLLLLLTVLTIATLLGS